jgi:hypothetical protein
MPRDHLTRSISCTLGVHFSAYHNVAVSEALVRSAIASSLLHPLGRDLVDIITNGQAANSDVELRGSRSRCTGSGNGPADETDRWAR